MMEIIIAMLEKMGEDVDYRVREIEEEKPELVITVDDFEGFGEDWSEIMREYDVDAVRALIDWLEEHCISEDGDFYSYYHFEEFDVQLGYSSYDI
jgi:hypothetical protein